MRVKNWHIFQHYKDRNPPWIKLHFSLLASRDWVALDDASRVLAIACMLIASRNKGEIPDDPTYMKRVAYLNKTPNFKPLIDCGFLEVDSECKQMLADARPEERREETETETEKMSGKPDPRSQAKEVLSFLNEKASRNYALNGANLEFVFARLKDGVSVEDLRAVVAKKCREWLGDEKMNLYLRPKTLFSRTNFAQYQGELASADSVS